MPVFMIKPIPWRFAAPEPCCFPIQVVHKPYHIEGLLKISEISQKKRLSCSLLRSGPHCFTLSLTGLGVNPLQAAENAGGHGFCPHGFERKVLQEDLMCFQSITDYFTLSLMLFTLRLMDSAVPYGRTPSISVAAHAPAAGCHEFERKDRTAVRLIVKERAQAQVGVTEVIHNIKVKQGESSDWRPESSYNVKLIPM
jgi:hypothetical protein